MGNERRSERMRRKDEKTGRRRSRSEEGWEERK